MKIVNCFNQLLPVIMKHIVKSEIKVPEHCSESNGNECIQYHTTQAAHIRLSFITEYIDLFRVGKYFYSFGTFARNVNLQIGEELQIGYI